MRLAENVLPDKKSLRDLRKVVLLPAYKADRLIEGQPSAHQRNIHGRRSFLLLYRPSFPWPFLSFPPTPLAS